ncbi:MAG: bifunctional demethylmenaquinone methyltransferase/2-methoxy-6-polyprenyl-1,4-benzoquinol methylase UbiE [Bosea sp. (in: a-proteobacteria)]|jgi:demethylmenaquinone methyltransferase/2-methoxy-6-polyprenyl-1,4-benzoquinol methylase
MTTVKYGAEAVAATTHFGFEKVRVEEKASRIAEVFDTVSSKYDFMNDVISLGTHRVLKWHAITASNIKPGSRVLDIAAGTGDLTILISKRIGPHGSAILSDINSQMLEAARKRLSRSGIPDNVQFLHADAEELHFADDTFDAVTIGYGIRNFTDKMRALREILRVLKPGGQLTIVEFSRPTSKPLRMMADAYSSLWPTLGEILVGNGKPYRYLVESIRMHPDQEAFKSMMQHAGYAHVSYENLMGGIAALHIGLKPQV